MSGKMRSYLLHLELDGTSDLISLADHGLVVGKKGWEFTSLVQTGSKDPGDLFDQRIGGEESIVLLGYK